MGGPDDVFRSPSSSRALLLLLQVSAFVLFSVPTAKYQRLEYWVCDVGKNFDKESRPRWCAVGEGGGYQNNWKTLDPIQTYQALNLSVEWWLFLLPLILGYVLFVNFVEAIIILFLRHPSIHKHLTSSSWDWLCFLLDLQLPGRLRKEDIRSYF